MKSLDHAFICRLLCASEASYGISPTGPFTQRQPYFDNVGYIGAPEVIAGGLDKIDAALVGLNDDGIIVAFRGTLPPTPPITPPVVLDWLQDFIAAPESFAGFPGKVHFGFHEAIMNIWGGVLKTVQALRASHPGANIYVTGHSKGGALASLGAWLLHDSGLTPAGVVSFASPHTGTADFAAAYNQVFSQVRYENYLDIVPFLPPSIKFFPILAKLPDIGKLFAGGENWNYTPVGNLQYIQEDGIVIGDYSGLEGLRVAEIVLEVASGNLSLIANAHSLVGYNLGYCRGACPSSICGA